MYQIATLMMLNKEATMSDERVARLFDYTKFHIGLYMTLGAGLVAVVAAAADEKSVLRALVSYPKLLAGSVFLMFVAGAAGGVIASSLTQVTTFDDFWTKR